VVVFFFLQSGLVGGELFPAFAELDLGDIPSEGEPPRSMQIVLPSASLARHRVSGPLD